MVTIHNSDGSITKISGGVLGTDQPETPVAPEPTTPQILEPYPSAQEAHAIENLKGAATHFHANKMNKKFVKSLKAVGITGWLEMVAELDPSDDPEELVITLLKEKGAVPSAKLFKKAFPGYSVELWVPLP